MFVRAVKNHQRRDILFYFYRITVQDRVSDKAHPFPRIIEWHEKSDGKEDEKIQNT